MLPVFLIPVAEPQRSQGTAALTDGAEGGEGKSRDNADKTGQDEHHGDFSTRSRQDSRMEPSYPSHET